MANFIRPEDVHFYEEIGVRNFKITGRTKPLGWLEMVLSSYWKHSHEGNLLQLLATDPFLGLDQLFYVENKALDTFLMDFPFDKYDDEEEYCKKWVSNLFLSHQLYSTCENIVPITKDGTVYKVTTGSVYDAKS